MPTIPAVDAHHHLWDLDVSHYTWLHPNPDGDPFPDFERICRDYTLRDYRSDLGGCDVVKSVHVQAEHDADDPVRETAWLQSIADAPGSGGFPHAIVAGIDLSRPDAEAMLEAHSGHANVRGVRQILSSHDASVSGESAEDALASRAAQLRDETWLRRFGMLRRFGLSFDLQVFAWQQEEASILLDRYDDVQIVLNHTLMPFDRTEEGIAQWRDGLAFFARHPHVALKISGLGMVPGGWDPAANQRRIVEAIEAFGTDRCFFGSNFPIDGLVTDARSLWSTSRSAIASFSEDERRSMLHGNAERVYRI